MKSDLFLPIYFHGLYAREEFDKIDLWSRDFFIDAVDFYSKKATSKQRQQIIAGIKYLSAKVKIIDEFEYIGIAWDQANTLMLAREVFFKGAVNLVTEFKREVSKILENRKNKIKTKNEIESKRLKEENCTNKILKESLINEIKSLKNNLTNSNQSFIIKNDDEMNEIFKIFQNSFECDYLTFRSAIESADFNRVNIKRKNLTQYLTYRLSAIMGKDWYSKVCETMQWEKSVCSGQGKKVEDYPEVKRLNKILPKPSKE